MSRWSLVVKMLIASAAVTNAGAVESLPGVYRCELQGGHASQIRSLEIRDSGYVFAHLDALGQTGKQVGRFTRDGEYLIIDYKTTYELYRVDGNSLVAESMGIAGTCTREQEPQAVATDPATAVTSTEESTNTTLSPADITEERLLGGWNADNVNLQIHLNRDGSATSAFQNEPPIEGNWLQLSDTTLQLEFKGNAKTYSYSFASDNTLELTSAGKASLLLTRLQ